VDTTLTLLYHYPQPTQGKTKPKADERKSYRSISSTQINYRQFWPWKRTPTTDEIKTIKHGSRDRKNDLAGLSTPLIIEMRQQRLKGENFFRNNIVYNWTCQSSENNYWRWSTEICYIDR
jgi:hypothetical protein